MPTLAQYKKLRQSTRSRITSLGTTVKKFVITERNPVDDVYRRKTLAKVQDLRCEIKQYNAEILILIEDEDTLDVEYEEVYSYNDKLYRYSYSYIFEALVAPDTPPTISTAAPRTNGSNNSTGSQNATVI